MTKTKLAIFTFCIFCLVIIGCSNTQTTTTTAASNPVAIANPASVKCVQDGGSDKIVMGANGEYGLCLFPDGSVCEEWAYMRGECKKGECARKCDFIGTRNEGWYDCNGKLLFWDNCTSENAAKAGTC